MTVRITIGALTFSARLETERAPRSCAAFLALMPFRNRIVQARWSGEAGWIPLGDFEFGVPPENQLGDPAPGQILLYPGGYSETEILFPYGTTRFASKLGPLAGNHFLTITEGAGQFEALGRLLLWEGAQEIGFDRS
jgi:hypothetical protein